jgi:hypothetical protein
MFDMSEAEMVISLTCAKGSGDSNTEVDDYGIKMIKALMDSAEINESDRGIKITMIKRKQ